MPNFEGLPKPHSTKITPESVRGLDPKVQAILLRHAADARRPKANEVTETVVNHQVLADAARHAKHIESTLSPEQDDN